MAEQSTFARRMMAQKLMAEKRDDPFSDSRFFNAAPMLSPDDMMLEGPQGAGSGTVTPGQVAYGVGATGTLFAPGAGVADVMGFAPDPFNQGQMLPSFGENVRQGKYLDAGLQTLGVAGDVLQAGGAVFPPLIAAGTALKAPRAYRVADAAMDAADAAKIDPNQATGAAMDAAQARYFETGNFEPPTADNPVSIVPPKPDEPGIIAFHGSGADFDEFRLEMIGTGEGAQAYGYGLYFTDSEDIAKFYRDTISMGNEVSYKGKPIKDLDDDYAPIEDNIAHMVGQQGTKKDQIRVIDDEISRNMRNLSAIKQSIKDYKANPEVYGLKFQGMELDPDIADGIKDDFKDKLDASIRVKENIDLIEVKPAGKMYKVGLAPKPDELLDYDAPFSAQSKDVQEKLLKAGYEVDPNTSGSGGMILDAIMSNVGREGAHLALGGKRTDARQIASQRMAEAGIPGIKYRAAGSRATTTADEAAERNYVIFDDKAVNIMEKYGIVGPVAVTAAGTAAVNRGRNDNDNGGSILPDAGVL